MFVCFSNLKAVSEAIPNFSFSHLINASDVLNEYENWYRVEGHQLNLTGLKIDQCSLEEEMKKVKTDECYK